MFQFANPELLYLLLILPVLIGIYLFSKYRKKKDLSLFGEKRLMMLMMPDYSHRRPILKFWLTFSCVALVIFVAAGPRFGMKKEVVKKQGIEVVLALDVSNSMLCEDVAPNRLEKAKQIMGRLVDKMKNDKVGLIVFAGQAFTQLPITADYVSAKMFFSTLNPDIVSVQGTAIGAAINLAARSFTANESSSKAIVVITDGENLEDNAVEAAQAAAEKGIRVSVIGVGTPQGAPIPTKRGMDYKKDASGNVVITSLNEKMCQEIAQSGKGIYARADNSNAAISALNKYFSELEQSDIESEVYAQYDEQFQAVAWLLLIVLLLELVILEKKNKRFSGFNLFKVQK